jgi:hypothetical protein
MAKNDQRRIVRLCVQPRELGWNGTHRNQLGAFDACELEFTWLTDIDQYELLARLQAALHIAGRDFER